MDAKKTRCGVCSSCIERELLFLSMMEECIWADAEGDLSDYLNRMALWIDLFNEQNGLKL